MRNRRATLSPFMAALTQRSIVKISLMAAKARNGVIGCGSDIPWNAKGEQLLLKAITYNQWLLVGRKTFEAMGLSQIESMQLSAAQDR